MQYIDLSGFDWREHRKFFEEPLKGALAVLSSGVDGSELRACLTIDGRKISNALYGKAARRYFRVFYKASKNHGIALGNVSDLMRLIAEDEAFRQQVGYRSLKASIPKYRPKQRRLLLDECLKLLGRLFSYSMFYHGRGWRLDGRNLVSLTLRNNRVSWDAWTFIRRVQDGCNVLYCPYCNSETIYAVEGVATTSGRIESSLDHFFPRNRYPYLGVSLYNLVPACARCNSGGKSSIDSADITVTPTAVVVTPALIHPYLESFHSTVRFEYDNLTIRLLSGCGRKEDVQIKAVPISVPRCVAAKKTISEFGLVELYTSCYWREFADLPAKMILQKTCSVLALKSFLEASPGFDEKLFNRLLTGVPSGAGSINAERLLKVKLDLLEQLSAQI